MSFIQTSEGYLQNTQDILHRIRELSVQSANGIYTAEDRMQIQVEVSAMVDEIDRIAGARVVSAAWVPSAGRQKRCFPTLNPRTKNSPGRSSCAWSPWGKALKTPAAAPGELQGVGLAQPRARAVDMRSRLITTPEAFENMGQVFFFYAAAVVRNRDENAGFPAGFTG